jgi:7 transmembrane receptor (rhodopsin family)
MMDFVNNVNTFTSSYGEEDDSADVILVDQYSNSISDSDLNRKFENGSVNAFFVYTPDLANFTDSPEILNSTVRNVAGYRDPLSIIVPISICYFAIFITGILGNAITCIVIAKNKTMHTATNYYLFNLAVSDFLVLILGKCLIFLKNLSRNEAVAAHSNSLIRCASHAFYSTPD